MLYDSNNPGKRDYSWDKGVYDEVGMDVEPYVYVTVDHPNVGEITIATVGDMVFGIQDERLRQERLGDPNEMARHIAACLNFLEGISTEGLEMITKSRSMLETVVAAETLRRQAGR